MEFFVVSTEPDYAGNVSKTVNIVHADGSIESFTADESNPRYIQFLEETE